MAVDVERADRPGMVAQWRGRRLVSDSSVRGRQSVVVINHPKSVASIYLGASFVQGVSGVYKSSMCSGED